MSSLPVPQPRTSLEASRHPMAATMHEIYSHDVSLPMGGVINTDSHRPVAVSSSYDTGDYRRQRLGGIAHLPGYGRELFTARNGAYVLVR